MARVNITIPDRLLAEARSAGLNISGLAAASLAETLDARGRIAELDAYLAEMEAVLGPIPAGEAAEAKEWADGVLGRVVSVSGVARFA